MYKLSFKPEILLSSFKKFIKKAAPEDGFGNMLLGFKTCMRQ